ncbi:Gfo/Idh/MocA family oxidoreductase [Cohnella pontilimi]|uniref:Gfo/Idh/MocA family oxidoreductase n=1 Tax=Cohnella pontilimi TaxID=2564100 RepID=A0A4U0FGK6_9BACL|nr:Gfo/Idh/MocA family oxidoreductase [Cohnella pontilimi]TJY44133.1 Gfo/Idh/MocA family oxidoreductase [Cohnella pontilimi]
MRTWGFAIIGCGMIAEFHIRALNDIPNTKLVAVSSRQEQKAKTIGEREQCSWTTNYHELLANPEVDIVIVATSSGSHASIGFDALRAGKHLVIEKPMAMTGDEARELIRLAEDKRLLLSVISQRRFEEPFQIVKLTLQDGRLGKLLLVEVTSPYYRTQAYYDSAEWRGTISQDGGALMNQGIHIIDVMLWLAGEVNHVVAKTATQAHRMEAEDLGLALIHFRNGAYGTLMASTSTKPGFLPTINLYGELGTIKIEGQEIKHWTVPGMEIPRYETSASEVGVSDPKSISHTYHQKQFMDVIHALETGVKPYVTGVDGLRAIAFIEAVYQSSASGTQITL